MSRKLDEPFESARDHEGHLPRDVYEWMATKPADQKASLNGDTVSNHPLDLQTLAASSLVQAAITAKRKTGSPQMTPINANTSG